MKTLILYKTKYGSTKEYAQWFNEDFGAQELLNLKDFHKAKLDDFDPIVIFSSVYVGQIGAGGFLKKHWEQLKDKKIVLLSVGAMPADTTESQKSYELLPQSIREKLFHYEKLPGKLDLNKMNFLDRFIIKKMGGENLNLMDRKLLKPIVEKLQQS